MRIYFVVLFVYAFFAFCAAIKHSGGARRFGIWSWRRKSYVGIWIIVAVISIVNGFRAFSYNHTFDFYSNLALGFQWLLIAYVPCGIGVFNKFWPIRMLRNSLFIFMGTTTILQSLGI